VIITRAFQNLSHAITPLTDEQIVFTIHHVLKALAIKGFENKDNIPSVTSFSASAVITPETSDIKIKQEQDIENTCRLF